MRSAACCSFLTSEADRLPMMAIRMKAAMMPPTIFKTRERGRFLKKSLLGLLESD